MIGLVLAVLAASAPGASPGGPPAARLEVEADGATLAVTVARGGATTLGALHVDCTAGCRVPVHYVEAIGDAPLGLFQLSDGDGLVYSVWGGGSAYRVRVYAVAATGVRRVLDASTRGTPSFSVDAAGRAVVGTTERGDRDPPDAPLHRVRWTWDHGRFVPGAR